jgi:hypothetical protein
MLSSWQGTHECWFMWYTPHRNGYTSWPHSNYHIDILPCIMWMWFDTWCEDIIILTDEKDIFVKYILKGITLSLRNVAVIVHITFSLLCCGSRLSSHYALHKTNNGSSVNCSPTWFDLSCTSSFASWFHWRHRSSSLDCTQVEQDRSLAVISEVLAYACAVLHMFIICWNLNKTVLKI